LAFQYEETIRSVRYYLVQLGPLFDPERDPLFAQAQASQVNRILTLLEEIPLDTASLLAALDALDHTLRQWYVQLPHGDVVTVASTLRAALHFMHRLQGLARKQARITYAG
jgi:hypothetical protein